MDFLNSAAHPDLRLDGVLCWDRGVPGLLFESSGVAIAARLASIALLKGVIILLFGAGILTGDLASWLP